MIKPAHAVLAAALFMQGCASTLTQSGSFSEDWRESVRLLKGAIAADSRQVECIYTVEAGHICAQVPTAPR